MFSNPICLGEGVSSYTVELDASGQAPLINAGTLYQKFEANPTDVQTDVTFTVNEVVDGNIVSSITLDPDTEPTPVFTCANRNHDITANLGLSLNNVVSTQCTAPVVVVGMCVGDYLPYLPIFAFTCLPRFTYQPSYLSTSTYRIGHQPVLTVCV